MCSGGVILNLQLFFIEISQISSNFNTYCIARLQTVKNCEIKVKRDNKIA